MGNNIYKTISVIMIFNLLSKGLGFLREYFMAIKFGTSIETDAYLIASSIPNILFVIIGAAITTTIVPIYNEIKYNTGKEEIERFTSNIISILVILSLILTVCCEVFTPQLVKLMAPGFKGYSFTLTITLTKILASIVILNTLSYIFIAILQSENKFTIPAIIGYKQYK